MDCTVRGLGSKRETLAPRQLSLPTEPERELIGLLASLLPLIYTCIFSQFFVCLGEALNGGFLTFWNLMV